jgi:MFS family permease
VSQFSTGGNRDPNHANPTHIAKREGPEKLVATLNAGRAWLDMALGALAMFTVFATAYSFGTFVKPIAAEFKADRGSTALVFGLTAFLYFVLGAVTGPLVQRVGPKRMVLFGGVVQVVGILAMTKVHSLWQAYATYCIGVGIGVACCYVPMVAVVGGWFTTKRPKAIGLAVSGIGLSSLLGAPIAARLIKAYGWRDAYQVFAIVTAVLLLIVATFIRTPASFATMPPLTLSSAVRTRTFVVLYLGTLMISIPLFSAFVNLVPYAEDNGIAKVRAALLISCIGAASIGGRIGLAWLAGRFGTGSVYATAFSAMAATQLIWFVAGKRFEVLVVFAVLFGFSYGGFISLSPAYLAEIFGPEQLGGLTGVNYSAAGIGALLGPTFGAWLVDHTGGYSATILSGLGAGVVGAALVWSVVLATRAGQLENY